MHKDNQLIKVNYCKKCQGYGVYYWQDSDDFHGFPIPEIITKKYQCEDCDGSGKHLRDSNGYPTCEFELDGIT